MPVLRALIRQRDDPIARHTETGNRPPAPRRLPPAAEAAVAAVRATLAEQIVALAVAIAQQARPAVRGAGRISMTANARFRQAPCMAALTATRFNPPLRAVYERLVGRVAAARKRLVWLITLVQRQRDFDPAWAATHPPRYRHP